MRGAGPIAAIGGLVAVLGSVLPWVRGRDPRPDLDLTTTAASSLGDFSYEATSSFPNSAAMVVLVAGLLITAGAMFQSWLVTVAGAIVGLAVAGLWLGLAARSFDAVSLPWSDLRLGAFLAIGGTLMAVIMGLSLRPRREPEEEEF